MPSGKFEREREREREREMRERERKLMPTVAQFGLCECLRVMRERERELMLQWHSLVCVNAFG